MTLVIEQERWRVAYHVCVPGGQSRVGMAKIESAIYLLFDLHGEGMIPRGRIFIQFEIVDEWRRNELQFISTGVVIGERDLLK